MQHSFERFIIPDNRVIKYYGFRSTTAIRFINVMRVITGVQGIRLDRVDKVSKVGSGNMVSRV